jgi:hypothetical protein
MPPAYDFKLALTRVIKPTGGPGAELAIGLSKWGNHSARAGAREAIMPTSELVLGALTQNRSSLEPSLGFAPIARHGSSGACAYRA